MPNLKVRLLSTYGFLPERKYQSAGYDLLSAKDMVIPAKGKAVVPLDIAIQLPSEDCYGRIAPRSGLAVDNFIDVGAGVIDYDYRGPVGVVLFNFSNKPFAVKHGDRIAQLIIEQITHPPVLCVERLDETQRGSGGFGSTGISDVPK